MSQRSIFVAIPEEHGVDRSPGAGEHGVGARLVAVVDGLVLDAGPRAAVMPLVRGDDALVTADDLVDAVSGDEPLGEG